MAASKLTHVSGLPALLDTNEITEDPSEVSAESKKSASPNGISDEQPSADLHREAGPKIVAPDGHTDSRAAKEEDRPFQNVEDPKKQSGLKPPRGREWKSGGEFDPSSFSENLANGIPIESLSEEGCSKTRRTVFGFGLSRDQQDVLFQYIQQKKAGGRPRYQRDHDALRECWGSPEPESDEEDADGDAEKTGVNSLKKVSDSGAAEEHSSGADAPVFEAPPLEEPDCHSGCRDHVCDGEIDVGLGDEEDALVEAIVCASSEELINPDGQEAPIETEELLLKGDSGPGDGMDKEGRKLDEILSNDSDKDKGGDVGEREDRRLLMQKVKDCYGTGKEEPPPDKEKKDAPETPSKMAVEDQCKPAASVAEDSPQNAGVHTVSDGAHPSAPEPEQRDGALPKHSTVLRAAQVAEDGTFSELWEDECMRYLEREPEFRARLQYEVRVILISPAFNIAGRTVPAFTRLYQKKFGKTVESMGFSSAARLCHSMPHVVQRGLLNDEGKLHLADTPKNHRIVAGIRSGLRRVVYDILRSHQGIDFDEMEEKCIRVFGQPLDEVLVEHGYHMPSVECMLRDMPDIAYLDEGGAETRVYLSKRAEDPALTDGLLVRRPDQDQCFLGMGEESSFSKGESSLSGLSYLQLLGEGNRPPVVQAAALPRSPEGSRMGPNGMAPEELSDLRVLCAAESNSPYKDASIYPVEDASPHVRLRFRLLLALHNEGRGVDVKALPTIYEQMFSVALDLPPLGFDSLEELVAAWGDVVLQTKSDPRWAVPVDTPENRRILNTVTSGLRSAVFAILLARYPEGLEPLELVECLEETLSGKLWDILGSNGYEFKDLAETKEVLSKSPSDFQLADCPELRLMLKDMEDFVRLGCREDGVLIMKLRDGEFPLLDLLDCDVAEGAAIGERPTRAAEDAAADHTEEGARNPDADTIDEVNPAMDAQTRNTEIGVIKKPAADSQIRAADYCAEVTATTAAGTQNFAANCSEEVFNNEASEKPQDSTVVPGLDFAFKAAESSTLSGAESSVDPKAEGAGDSPEEPILPSPCLLSQLVVAKGQAPSPKLEHELRMILGCPEYMDTGLSLAELCAVYRDRCGRPLEGGPFTSVEDLLASMPDVVKVDFGCGPGGKMFLVQSRRNLRILSVAKVGLRQVLFWALLKNPGGVWAELLEGWYFDFAGWQLSSTLAGHGYEKSRRIPRLPVAQFLDDMADILKVNDVDTSLYVWGGFYEDPTVSDAALLGLPLETIQYDPLREEYENTRRHADVSTAGAVTSLPAAPVCNDDDDVVAEVKICDAGRTDSGGKLLDDIVLTTIPVARLELDLECESCKEDMEAVLRKAHESGADMNMKIHVEDGGASGSGYAVLRCRVTPGGDDDGGLSSRQKRLQNPGSEGESELADAGARSCTKKNVLENFLEKTLLPPAQPSCELGAELGSVCPQRECNQEGHPFQEDPKSSQGATHEFSQESSEAASEEGGNPPSQGIACGSKLEGCIMISAGA